MLTQPFIASAEPFGATVSGYIARNRSKGWASDIFACVDCLYGGARTSEKSGRRILVASHRDCPEPDGVYGPLGRRWLRGGSQRNVTVRPVVPATKLKAGGPQLKAQAKSRAQQRGTQRERELEEALDTQDAG